MMMEEQTVLGEMPYVKPLPWQVRLILLFRRMEQRMHVARESLGRTWKRACALPGRAYAQRETRTMKTSSIVSTYKPNPSKGVRYGVHA
jgi:hypothetical protein